MNGLTLYYFPTCPFCMKVLAFLKLKGIEIEKKNTRQDEQAYQELMSGGGKTQVPCLRIQDGDQVKWLYESDDIIKYLGQNT